MWYKIAFLGSPGTGKSTMGLSAPGVEHHVFGSSEETTALNFQGRTDLLPPVKLDWYETLKPEERAKFIDEKPNELEIAKLTKVGRARNVARYRRYLYQVKNALLEKTRPELQALFLDNFAPFAVEFEDYVETVWERDFITKDGNFDTIAYYKRYSAEVMDFLRLFMGLPCHTMISCHVAMTAGEEVAANTQFLQGAKRGGVKKEWMPLIPGRARFMLAAIPDWVFFCKMEEAPGQPTKYVCKLEADESNVGVAKPRVQPYVNPRRILYTRNQFFSEFQQDIETFLKTGKPVNR